MLLYGLYFYVDGYLTEMLFSFWCTWQIPPKPRWNGPTKTQPVMSEKVLVSCQINTLDRIYILCYYWPHVWPIDAFTIRGFATKTFLSEDIIYVVAVFTAKKLYACINFIKIQKISNLVSLINWLTLILYKGQL